MTARRVHLWPLEGASVPGVPHTELLVDAETADYITGHQPPAFARSKPDGWEDGEVIEWSRPDAPQEEQQPEAAPEGAVSDSEEPA